MFNQVHAIIKNGQLDIGRVVIPSDMDRDEYIARCSETGRIGVYVIGIGVIPDMIIGKSAHNYIEYPKNSDEYGSSVLYIKLSDNRHYVIFDVLRGNNEVDEYFEGVFILKKSLGDKSVSISGDAKSANISVSAKSGDNHTDIQINADGMDVKSKNVSHESNSNTVVAFDKFEIIVPNKNQETEVSIKYKKGEGFTYIDEFDNKININDGKIEIKSKVINLGDGEEPLLLGDTTVKFLKDFINAVSNITVATSLGTQPILNKVQVEALKAKLEPLKSKISNTD